MSQDSRRSLLKSIAAASAANLLPVRRAAAAEEPYPHKPVVIVFPYAAGGSVDSLIRAVAEQLTSRFGQSFVVDNRPGAGSSIGAEYVAHATPDGLTLLWAGWATLTTNFALYRKLRYKVDDFAPITSTFNGVIGLAVQPSIPATNFKELVEYLKRSGTSFDYGTAGIGSSPHLLMQLGAKTTGINFTMLSYKGETQGITDVIGGHLMAFAGSVSNLIQHHRSGAIRLIAVSSTDRLPAYSDVPTFHEVGYSQLDFAYWHGLLAPAGTPGPIISSLNAAVVDAMKSPAVQVRLSPDQRAMTSTPEQFRDLIARDKVKWGDLVTANHLTAD